MSDYVITTDNTADLPEEYIRQYQLGMMSLTYTIDGKTYNREHGLSCEDFYARMRAGSMPTTSQVNPEEAKKEFRKSLEKSKHIIHIAFSGGLSGSCNSARIAAEELMEEQPDCRITVIDSLCASLGEGLLVHYALRKQKEGMAYEELVDWLEGHKLNVVHNFTVDDLFHLYRGGRVSRATAVVGTILNIKPVLHVDNEGHLIPVSKVRGRKQSLDALVRRMEDTALDPAGQMVFISHGDCLEDARYVERQIREKLGVRQVELGFIGPVIGAHSGPGTVALFFLGKER